MTDTSDLVGRLRRRAESPDLFALMDEAANTIQRLEAERDGAKQRNLKLVMSRAIAEVSHHYWQLMLEAADTIQRLESANTELRIRYANAQAKIGRMEDRIQQVGS
jgi:hypothetical protein